MRVMAGLDRSFRTKQILGKSLLSKDCHSLVVRKSMYCPVLMSQPCTCSTGMASRRHSGNKWGKNLSQVGVKPFFKEIASTLIAAHAEHPMMAKTYFYIHGWEQNIWDSRPFLHPQASAAYVWWYGFLRVRGIFFSWHTTF